MSSTKYLQIFMCIIKSAQRWWVGSVLLVLIEYKWSVLLWSRRYLLFNKRILIPAKLKRVEYQSEVYWFWWPTVIIHRLKKILHLIVKTRKVPLPLLRSFVAFLSFDDHSKLKWQYEYGYMSALLLCTRNVWWFTLLRCYLCEYHKIIKCKEAIFAFPLHAKIHWKKKKKETLVLPDFIWLPWLVMALYKAKLIRQHLLCRNECIDTTLLYSGKCNYFFPISPFHFKN